MSSNVLNKLLIKQLNEISDAEQQLLVALPKLADAATGENLKQAFLDHLVETKSHSQRLEKAFQVLGIIFTPSDSVAMKGLIAAGDQAIETESAGAVRDIALIGAARRVEHYEIAAYKTMRALATAAKEENIADLIQQTLDEECDADKRLCTLGDLAIEAAQNLQADIILETDAKKTRAPKAGKGKNKPSIVTN